MVRRNKNKRKTTSKRAQPRRRVRRSTRGPSYAQMVADPCNGPLIEGLYASVDGMLNKLKTTHSPTQAVVDGYILWDPNYTSGNDNPGTFNCVIVFPATSSENPDNTTSLPFGSNGAATQLLEVGAGPFCQSDTVADARCVGACLRATYLGRMDAASGSIAVIENIPAKAVLGVNGTTGISVDELFALSTKIERAGIDTHEVKFRPSEHSATFRANTEGTFNFATGAVTTITAEAERSGSHMMGFAFRGITSLDDFLFEFHQNIEWRPNVDAGFISRVPRQIHEQGHVSKVVKYLDTNHPGWPSNVGKQIGNLATQFSQMALTGTMGRMGQKFLQRATQSSLSYLAAEAPLLL